MTFIMLAGELIPKVVEVTTDPNMVEIQRYLTKAQLYMGGMVVGVGGFMSMVAGLMHIIGIREEARKRFKDVLQGTIMVLTGPTAVFLIATLIKAFLPGGIAHA